MTTLEKLRQKLNGLKAEGAAILARAEKDNGRDLTDAEAEQFAAIETRIAEAAAEVSAEEERERRRRLVQPVQSAPGGARSPALSTGVGERMDARTGGFNDVVEFALAVRQASHPGAGGGYDERLRQFGAPTNVHQGGASTGEGYMIPPEYRDQIWEVVQSTDDILGLVDVEPTSSREVKLIADETTPWGASGISASWRSEGVQMSPTKLVTDPRSVPLHELYVLALATEEMRDDAPRLADRITRKAALALQWKISDSIVYGTGAGQPLGWFNSPARVSVAKESGQAADTIVADNVLKMASRLLVMPGDRPVWLANRDTLPELATMTIGDQPAWIGAGMLQNAPGGQLLGYPVIFTEHAKTVGDQGDLQLVNPRGYYAARRTASPQFASSIHLFFDYAVETFRWMFRFGGQPYLSAPMSPANGASSKSHFVVLDARA